MIDDIAPGKIIKAEHIKRLAQKLKDQRQVHTGTELPDHNEYEKGDLFYLEGSSVLYIKESGGWSNIQADPYASKLVQTPNGNMVYRIYVDGTNGLDTNTGFEQDKPVKTIAKAHSLLPIDLGGYGAMIIIKPGTYIMPRFVEFNNGFVDYVWYGKAIYESGLDDSNGWIGFINYLGLTDSSLTSDQVIFINETNESNDAFYFKGSEMTYSFSANNQNLAYNEVGKHYAERIVFKVNPDLPEKTYIDLVVFDKCNYWNEGQQQLFDATSCTTGVAFLWNASCFVRSIKIITNDVNGKTSVGQWVGALVFASDSGSGEISKVTCGYAVGYGGTDGITITGFKQLFSNFNRKAENGIINFTGATINQGNLATAEYQHYLSADFKGYFEYNSTVAVLSDNSLQPHIVKNESVTKTYISSKVKQTSNNAIVGVLTSVPSDSELSNKDLVFYMDEATDTLKVKYRDSTGAIFIGNLSSLTAS